MDVLGVIGVSCCMKVGGLIGCYLYYKDDLFCLNCELDDIKYIFDYFFIKLLYISESMNMLLVKDEVKWCIEYMFVFLE